MAGQPRHEVIVVGGGIYGASILYHLAVAGVGAILLERDHLAEGPTGRSSANIRLHYTTPEMAEIAWRSYQITSRFRELTGADNGFVRVGVLYGCPPETAPILEANVVRLASQGIPIETRTVAEMATIVPGFRLDGLALGVWEPTTGYADPVGTTRGFVEKAQTLGATARVNTPVGRLIIEDGRVIGVGLVDGTVITGPRVIVAAGPWSRPLLATAGADLPTYPERHAITLVDAPAGSRSVVPCVWSDRIRRYYARPEGDELVLFGGETTRTGPVVDPDDWDETVPLSESAEHISRASARIPALEALGIRPGYAGLYDMTADSFPIVDGVPGVRGLFVAAGTSGHGFKLAPALGGLAADLVLGRRSTLLDPLRWDRPFTPTGELSR